MKSWKVLSSEYLLKRWWLSIRVDEVQTGRGTVLSEFHMVESPDWVGVVALTADRQAVLVRQYRHGFGGTTLELPAGAVDQDEPPLEAAKRELLEETGYATDDWQLLDSVHPETSRHQHRAHLFLARDVSLVAAQKLDPTEEVEVCLVPIRTLDELLPQLPHGIHQLAVLLAGRAELSSRMSSP